MKIIRKTAIVMLLCLYFLTYGVLPQVQAAGKDAPVIVVAASGGGKSSSGEHGGGPGTGHPGWSAYCRD